MSPPKHVRSTSHGKKVIPAHARPTKPSPLKTNKHASAAVLHKTGPGWSKAIGKKEIAQYLQDEDEDDMAALPSFCTYCEKQIVTPCNTVLYCSESCRRKDGNKPLSAASIESPEPSPRTLSVSSDVKDYPDIIPHRSPTMRPASLASADGTSFFDIDSLSSRTESEAAKYLSQFQSGSLSPTRQRRPQYRRAQTSSTATMPSLSHTPGSLVSPSSSFSTQASSSPYQPVRSSNGL